MLSRHLLGMCTVGTLALATHNAQAQTQAQALSHSSRSLGDQALPDATQPDTASASQPSAATQDIVVTGSRISINGFKQPTPVTTVGGSELAARAPGLISDSLNQLPAFHLGQTPSGGQTSTGQQGPVTLLNLRGLGPNRTLVLLDGSRLTPSTTGNAPDIGLLPQNLVSRVDVVTGGASAAYGSDAVAGVVNFILDTKFKGLKAEAQSGISTRGDNATYKASLAAGTDFAGGRGHIIASAEYFNSEGITGSGGRDWADAHYLLIPNPAVTTANPASPNNPTLLLVPNARISNLAIGGLITSGPLAGTAFNAAGQAFPFNYGTLRSSTFMQGGDGPYNGVQVQLATPVERYNLFTEAHYDLSDSVEAWVRASHGHQYSRATSIPYSQNFTIFNDNAFLPDDVRLRMATAGVSSFPLGRSDLDLGPSITVDRVEGTDFTAGLKGTLELAGSPFKWNTEFHHGFAEYSRHIIDDINLVNIYNGVDSVRVTSANVGTSGLPIGSIVCRTRLTNPSNGCVSVNPFGPGSFSSDALNYLRNDVFFVQRTKMDAGSFDVQGSPFALPAGAVTVAFGGEARRISTRVTSDPLSQTLPSAYIAATAAGLRGFPASLNTTNPGLFQFGNYQPSAGSYSVQEGFVEVNIPLLKDTAFADSLGANGAYRFTHYSTSGSVSTWKAGLTWDFRDWIRFRGTRSRDIRAPNIGELYQGSRLVQTIVTDPANNNQQITVNAFQSGNSALKPERADTSTIGIILHPGFLPGLDLSLDGYAITVKGAIAAPAAQDVLNACAGGDATYCSLVQRSNGTVQALFVPFLNLQSIRQRGLDIEIGYRHHFGSNVDLTMRALASYVDDFSAVFQVNGPRVQKAGEVGPTTGQSLLGIPRWTGSVNATLAIGGFSAFVQERYVGGGTFNNTYNTSRYNAAGTSIIYVSDNRAAERFYTDLTLTLKVADSPMAIFATVNNLFDRSPPIDPNTTSIPSPTNGALYDTVGRMMTIGVRLKI